MPYSDKVFLDEDRRIALYKRTDLDRPKWQARISVPGATGYKVISTKTSNFEDAKFFAKQLYQKLCIQVQSGGALNPKTFKKVFDEWKVHASSVGATRSGGTWDTTIARIESYALPYFGNMRIDQIGEPEFTDYWSWRRAHFNKKMPSNDTLRRERTCIMPVFKFAKSKGYISQLPETNTPKPKGGRRPTFTDDEWEQIRKAGPDWVQDSMGHPTYRDRFMAHHFFLVLANTGLRVGELCGLRWADLFEVVETDETGKMATFMACRAKGKTGERQAIFQHAAKISIHGINAYRTGELLIDQPERAVRGPDKNEAIFCHADGRPIKEFKRSFASLLKFASVPIEIETGRRAIYSLRHLYATKRLSEETSPFLLAKQMGTSIEMFEKHYGQVLTPTVARQITKTKPISLKVV